MAKRTVKLTKPTPTPRVSRSLYRAAANVVEGLGQLYASTRGRGPHWRKGVAALAQAMR